uniref:Galectin n=1 Tax=Culex tarsalis TaxID=7177 RepID=A0A1Q3G4P1_CULTA
MATIPVFNPTIPFLGEIPGGMVIGKKLHIRGQILSSDGMFNINVQSGGAVQPRDDTPLHISIRISDRVVVLNSFEGGTWQQEERHSGRPVREGETFDLLVKAKAGHFKIEINGKKLGKFEHRLPVETARFVHIGEGAMIESITESW